MEKNNSNYTQEEKEALIKKEVSKLKANFKDLPKEKKDNAISLIDEASFLKVTLLDLRLTVNREGTESTYQNGENQWGTKKSPAFENYLNANKQFMAIMKQLDDMLPEASAIDPAEELLKFAIGGKR